jgi:hypothetical protein
MSGFRRTLLRMLLDRWQLEERYPNVVLPCTQATLCIDQDMRTVVVEYTVHSEYIDLFDCYCISLRFTQILQFYALFNRSNRFLVVMESDGFSLPSIKNHAMHFQIKRRQEELLYLWRGLFFLSQ